MMSLLTNRIRSAMGETALLEACDWDEEKVEELLKDLNSVFADFKGFLPDQLLDKVRKALRKKGYDDELIRLLFAYLEIEIENEVNTLKGEA